MPNPPPATLRALHAAYRRGSWRPSEVVEYWLARAESERAHPVWISVVEPARLRERAVKLDKLLASDLERALALPLFGALFAVKDNIDVAGMTTTAACPAFGYVPPRSAAVVDALEAAGAILVGKTNLDQFATGLVGTRSPYGAVPNAFDPALISGGSSSGSAVAVAAGLVHFALGTDTAGSGRVPAGLNNIVGWKPTRGLLSTDGVVPACRSLDCVSIFALTVADAARVFAAAATHAVPLDAPRLGSTLHVRAAAARPVRVLRRQRIRGRVLRCRRAAAAPGRHAAGDRLRAMASRGVDALRRTARGGTPCGHPQVLRRAARRARPDGARHHRRRAPVLGHRRVRRGVAPGRDARDARAVVVHVRRAGGADRARPRTRSRTSRPSRWS